MEPMQVPKVPMGESDLGTQPRFKSWHFLQFFRKFEVDSWYSPSLPTETRVLRIEVHSCCRKIHGGMIPWYKISQNQLLYNWGFHGRLICSMIFGGYDTFQPTVQPMVWWSAPHASPASKSWRPSRTAEPRKRNSALGLAPAPPCLGTKSQCFGWMELEVIGVSGFFMELNLVEFGFYLGF